MRVGVAELLADRRVGRLLVVSGRCMGETTDDAATTDVRCAQLATTEPQQGDDDDVQKSVGASVAWR